jgi:hypothetical protein
MAMSHLLLLLLAGAAILFWLDGARARELATGLVLRYCRNRNLQFLDGTVALARMGIRWTPSGLRIRRMFRFDFSLEGVGRRTGFVLMLGTTLETVDDGLPNPDEPAAAAPPQTDGAEKRDAKVVPFRRRDR